MISEKNKLNAMLNYIIEPIPIKALPRNYDKTKDSDYRNPIYYPKKKKYGKK